MQVVASIERHVSAQWSTGDLAWEETVRGPSESVSTCVGKKLVEQGNTVGIARSTRSSRALVNMDSVLRKK